MFLIYFTIPELGGVEEATNGAEEGISPTWRRIWWRRLLIGLSAFQAMALLLVIVLTINLFTLGLAQSDQRMFSFLLSGSQFAVFLIFILLIVFRELYERRYF